MPFQFKRLSIPEVVPIESLGFKDGQGLFAESARARRKSNQASHCSRIPHARQRLVSQRGISRAKSSRAIANHRALEGTRDLNVRARLIHNEILDRWESHVHTYTR